MPRKKSPILAEEEDTATEPRLRGKRKQREYRFESVDSDGTIQPVSLLLTHKASAIAVKEFLNSLAADNDAGITYRFGELIIHQ